MCQLDSIPALKTHTAIRQDLSRNLFSFTSRYLRKQTKTGPKPPDTWGKLSIAIPPPNKVVAPAPPTQQCWLYSPLPPYFLSFPIQEGTVEANRQKCPPSASWSNHFSWPYQCVDPGLFIEYANSPKPSYCGKKHSFFPGLLTYNLIFSTAEWCCWITAQNLLSQAYPSFLPPAESKANPSRLPEPLAALLPTPLLGRSPLLQKEMVWIRVRHSAPLP